MKEALFNALTGARQGSNVAPQCHSSFASDEYSCAALASLPTPLSAMKAAIQILLLMVVPFFAALQTRSWVDNDCAWGVE